MTSPWIVLDAVRELAVIPNAWAFDMVVNPLIVRAPLMLPDTLRLVVLILFAVNCPKVAREPALVVDILFPRITGPLNILLRPEALAAMLGVFIA
jgi:hypothetical protein